VAGGGGADSLDRDKTGKVNTARRHQAPSATWRLLLRLENRKKSPKSLKGTGPP